MFPAHPVNDWSGVSAEERARTLEDLLDLVDAVRQGSGGKPEPSLARKVLAVDGAMSAAELPHAFGGAIALAYCGEPRATVDVDINVFLSVDRWPEISCALSLLGIEVEVDEENLQGEGEVRLDWNGNDIHLFFSNDALHDAMPAAVRLAPFAGTTIPIVSAEHLIVRKALIGRPKDWLDIEAILAATEPLDRDEVLGWLGRLAGPTDPRLTRLEALLT